MKREQPLPVENGSRLPRVALNCLAGVAPTHGARVYMLGLARSLAQLKELNLVLFVARGESLLLPPDLRTLAYEVDVKPGRSYRQVLRAAKISRALRIAEIDLWHLPNTLPLLWRPRATVMTIHDLVDIKVRKYGIVRTVYRWIVNLISSRVVDKVITVSESSKRDISKYLALDPEKIHVIYQGFDEMFYPSDVGESRAKIRERFGVDEYFLCPGGIRQNKNITLAVRALAHYSAMGGSTSLIITGEGSSADRRSLCRIINDLGMEKRVVLAGCLPRSEMPSMYRAAVGVIYPSLYEGFGLPVLEGMACGCPVVACNTSSLPEAAGNAAILVEPDDEEGMASAMRRIASDPAVREKLITRGLERARHFSWLRAAEETAQVYRTVLNGSRSS